jgi:hypothetical protein
MLDIRGGSDIISLSLGDAREFVLTSEEGVEQQRVVLEDGDLFVLGPRTNATLNCLLKKVKIPLKCSSMFVPVMNFVDFRQTHTVGPAVCSCLCHAGQIALPFFFIIVGELQSTIMNSEKVHEINIAYFLF